MILSVTDAQDAVLIGTHPSTPSADLLRIAEIAGRNGEVTISGQTITVHYEGDYPTPAWLVELTLRDRFAFAQPAPVRPRTTPAYLAGSLLITGTTGSGKSTLLRSLAGNYIASGVDVVLIDPQGRTWSDFESGPKVSTAANIAEAALLLGHLSDAVRVGTARPTVVLIDEFYSLSAAAQYTEGLTETRRDWIAARARQLQDDLRVLLHRGPALGVVVVAASSRVDAVTAPPVTWSGAGRVYLRGRHPVTEAALAVNFGGRAESARAMFENTRVFERYGVVIVDGQLFGFDPSRVAAVVAA